MFDREVEPPLPRYRVCRAGFAMVSVGLSLLALSAAVTLARMFVPSPDLERMVADPLWRWVVGAPITWLTLIGSYLLWAGWTDQVWRRKAGLLLLMNSIDAVQWTLDHAEDLGLRVGAVGHPWLRYQAGSLFNWVEFALAARLAFALTERLGGGDAALRHKARMFCLAGMTLWAFGFLRLTDWLHPWPLIPRGRRLGGPIGLLMLLGMETLTLLALLNIIPLCVSACRACSRAAAEGPGEEEQGADLLRSRSETWEEENPWKSPDQW